MNSVAESLIHLRLSAARKGRWVRESRADGLRLTDWIINIVEEHIAATGARRDEMKSTTQGANASLIDAAPALIEAAKRAAHLMAELQSQTPQILACRGMLVDAIKAADPAYYGG